MHVTSRSWCDIRLAFCLVRGNSHISNIPAQNRTFTFSIHKMSTLISYIQVMVSLQNFQNSIKQTEIWTDLNSPKESTTWKGNHRFLRFQWFKFPLFCYLSSFTKRVNFNWTSNENPHSWLHIAKLESSHWDSDSFMIFSKNVNGMNSIQFEKVNSRIIFSLSHNSRALERSFRVVGSSFNVKCKCNCWNLVNWRSVSS